MMQNALRAVDARHLRHLRKLTNWPLGESGFFARIEWLTRHPQFQDNDQGKTLVENLADFYTTIHSTFDEFRPPFDSMDAYRPRHPQKVRQAARLHFWELVTTTRFELADLSQASKIIATKFNPCKPLEPQHSVALAALVFVKEAIETLEDSGNLQEAAKSCNLAAMWLAHLETLNVASIELNHAVTRTRAETVQKIKFERSKQARQAASKLRTALTPALVASHFKANTSKPQKALVLELIELYNVSTRTVNTRLKEAKTLNLMQ